MAAKTFLELVNYVLHALREDEVQSFAESYTKMIAQFVNDAKEEVEDAGPWKALRTEISFTSNPSETFVEVTGTNYRSYILRDKENTELLFRSDSGSERRIPVVPLETVRNNRLSAQPVSQEPYQVAFGSDGTQLVAYFYPTPDTAYTYTGIFVVPQDELVETTDTLTIPWKPVVRQAVYFAMDERGSEFAGRVETEAGKAQDALMNAILSDFGADDMTLTEQ